MLKKYTYYLLVWIATIIFSTLGVEVFLKVFSPIKLTGGYIGNYEYDKDLGVKIKKGFWTNTTDYKQEVYVNKFGTINFERSFEDYQKKIFALGDSYTQGTGLPADSSYPFKLSMELNVENDIYKKKFAVINLGLSAYGGEQNIIAYKKYKKIFGTPDYVLYLGCGNDFNDDQLFLNGTKHKSLVENSEFYRQKILFFDDVYPIMQFLIHNTEIGKRLNIARKQIYNINKKDKKIQNNSNISNAELQKRHLEWIMKESKKENIKFIVGWANLDTPNDKSYSWLKNWATANNVDFADWEKLVISTSNNVPDLPLYNDHSGGHYRGWVNTLISKSFLINILNSKSISNR